MAVPARACSLLPSGQQALRQKGDAMQRKTRLALIGAAAALVVGIGGIGIASADDTATGRNPLSTLLSNLVGQGTITQDQADAITAAMDEEHAAHEQERAAHEQDRQDAITKVTGLEWSAIQDRLAKGETLAAIAGDKKDALIKALVAVEEKHIDQHVADGRFTEAQATEMKSGLTARITAMVEGKGPHMGREFGEGDEHGPGMGHHEGRGHHGNSGFGDDSGFGPMGTPPWSGEDD